MSDLYIKAVASIPGTSRTTATLMKTGQTTSYRTGDDGDLEAGRGVDFFTLAENNPFGNTNRFTDELGGSTYANNIVIDWSTYNGGNVLGYKRTTNGVDITWNDAIDGALAVSIGTFTTGWRLPNVIEIMSLWNGSASLTYNYSPLNLNAGGNWNIWTSNTPSLASTVAWVIQIASIGSLNYIGKTLTSSGGNGCRYIPCRTFTVTGITLS